MFKYELNVFSLRKNKITCLYLQQQHKEKKEGRKEGGKKGERKEGKKAGLKPHKNLVPLDVQF